jgi:phage terminase Nu1 subunit (DNA packaging protein)
MAVLPKLATLAKELGVSKGRVSQMKAAGMPVNSIEAAKAWKVANVRARFDVGGGDQVAAVTYDIAEARAKREHHEANIAAMKELQLAGALVEKDRVERSLTAIAAEVRSSFERLPDKLADVLAAETDAHQVHSLLVAEIDQVLEDLAAQITATELVDAARH